MLPSVQQERQDQHCMNIAKAYKEQRVSQNVQENRSS